MSNKYQQLRASLCVHSIFTLSDKFQQLCALNFHHKVCTILFFLNPPVRWHEQQVSAAESFSLCALNFHLAVHKYQQLCALNFLRKVCTIFILLGINISSCWLLSVCTQFSPSSAQIEWTGMSAKT